MQEYMREQTANTASVNLVSEIVEFLLSALKTVDFLTIHSVTQAVETLTEFIQGPCVGNQMCLISCGIVKVFNTVMPSKFPLCDPHDDSQVQRLKTSTVTLLLSLLEGDTPDITDSLVKGLDLDALADEMDASHNRNLRRNAHKPVPPSEYPFGFGKSFGRPSTSSLPAVPCVEQADPLQDELSLGCDILIAFRTLLDRVGTTENATRLRGVLAAHRSFKEFADITASVEIVRSGSVERMYFRVPDIGIQNLREDTRNALIDEVDRTSQPAKLQDFFDRAHGLIDEINYFHDHLQHPVFAWLNHYKSMFFYTLMVTSFGINIIFIINIERGDNGMLKYWSPATRSVVTVLGSIQLLVESVVFIDFVLGPLQVIIQKETKRLQLQQEDVRNQRQLKYLNILDATAAPSTATIGQRLMMLINCPMLWKRLFFFLCSVFGLIGIWHNFFYSAQLLGIVELSTVLQNVVKAVIRPAKALALTAGFGLIVVYVFAYVGFFFFSEKYEQPDEFGAGFNCQTLSRCLVVQTVYGLRFGGGIGDALVRPTFRTNKWQSYSQVLFEFLFFLVMIIVFLNIVFGIIIDTFAELRAEREAMELDMRSKCFICGISAAVFDRQASGFRHHVQFEHNMWSYLYLFHYLQLKPVHHHNGLEGYVYNLIRKRSTSFFPMHRAVALGGTLHDDP